MTRLAVALRAARSSRWGEIRDVAEAQIALLRAESGRWLRPPGTLVDVGQLAAGDTQPVSDEVTKTCARLARAVDRAARYGVFHPQCLARAIALGRMLDARNIDAYRIRIGVRKEEGTFAAHAWVELGDGVFGDTTGNTNSYVPLTDVSVSSSRVFRFGARGAARSEKVSPPTPATRPS